MVIEIQRKAATLIEALPYIRRFAGETLVVKYGGHAMSDTAAAESFAQDVTLLQSIGIRVIVVHGGGPQIGDALHRLGIQTEFKAGYRVTDAETMRVVRMVLVGDVNQDVVARINQAGGRAVGLSGADGLLLQGRKVTVSGEDVGRVGIIESVNDAELLLLTGGGVIPVISPVAIDSEGQPLNVNADLVAGAVAAHSQARKLLLMTDVDGVRDEDGQVISSLGREAAVRMLEDGIVTGGMRPKLKCAVDAVDAGVRKVHIVDGRMKHAMLLELFTDTGVGTQVVP